VPSPATSPRRPPALWSLSPLPSLPSLSPATASLFASSTLLLPSVPRAAFLSSPVLHFPVSIHTHTVSQTDRQTDRRTHEHTHAHARTHALTHARTHTHTHARTHTHTSCTRNLTNLSDFNLSTSVRNIPTSFNTTINTPLSCSLPPPDRPNCPHRPIDSFAANGFPHVDASCFLSCVASTTPISRSSTALLPTAYSASVSIEAKETYYSARQKRPTIEAKETYYSTAYSASVSNALRRTEQTEP
jgi:hypothetical protein